MSDAKPTKETLRAQMAGAGMTRDAICAQLGVGSHRVRNILKEYQATRLIPAAPSRARARRSPKRQQVLQGDTDNMMSIRQRVHGVEIGPELCLGGDPDDPLFDADDQLL
jgi:transposase